MLSVVPDHACNNGGNNRFSSEHKPYHAVTDDTSTHIGMYIGVAILLFTLGFAFFAHWASWNRQRSIQKIQAWINGNLWLTSINKFKPKAYFQKKDISPYFWVNGKLPVSATWRALAENGFKDYKLVVGGMVERPMEFSIEELKKLGKE